MTPTIVKAESGYIKDPLALFYELTQGTKNNILLESQEIHTKAGTQSLLGVSSALRISCMGHEVTIRVLNENGEYAAEQLLPLIENNVRIEKLTDAVGKSRNSLCSILKSTPVRMRTHV